MLFPVEIINILDSHNQYPISKLSISLGDPPSSTTTSVQKINIKEIALANRLKVKDDLGFL
jgi:hypothetical protein